MKRLACLLISVVTSVYQVRNIISSGEVLKQSVGTLVLVIVFLNVLEILVGRFKSTKSDKHEVAMAMWIYIFASAIATGIPGLVYILYISSTYRGDGGIYMQEFTGIRGWVLIMSSLSMILTTMIEPPNGMYWILTPTSMIYWLAGSMEAEYERYHVERYLFERKDIDEVKHAQTYGMIVGMHRIELIIMVIVLVLCALTLTI